jgi:hypothetical protein
MPDKDTFGPRYGSKYAMCRAILRRVDEDHCRKHVDMDTIVGVY